MQAPRRLSWLLGLALCACASQELGPSPVPGLIEAGDYARAVEVAAERRDARPDEVTEREHRLATVAWILGRARTAALQERHEDALELVLEAAELEPDVPVVVQWLAKTRGTLADRYLTLAQELASRQDLDGALEAFDAALTYAPDDAAALAGKARVLIIMEYREGRGEEYYRQGVSALRKAWLHQARGQFNYVSKKYIPGFPDAEDRSERVGDLLAVERVAEAKALEESGDYHAAGTAYRLALALDPENVDAQEGSVRIEREIGAKDLLSHAEWLRVRGRFGEAREALDEGAEITQVQGDQFASARIDIEQAEHRLLYDEALRLEHDFQYEEAVSAYGDLIEVAGYYKDAIARRETLQDFIEQAEDLYARAMESGDVEERLDYLRQLRLFWPEYRDVEAQIAALSGEAEPD